MATRWIERVTGSFDDKRRWRAYKARKAQLPTSHRTAIEGVERYLVRAGAIVDGDVLMQMLEDLADLIEGAAADGTAVRDVVGDDPVAFADAFVQSYAEGQWVERERTRLAAAIDRAADQDTTAGAPTGEGRT